MRHCIKEPTPAVLAVSNLLAKATNAHLCGDQDVARRYFRKADSLSVFFWLNPAWWDVEKNVVHLDPPGDTYPIPRDQRDRDRSISMATRRAVLERDGYRCRYCGLPVVPAEIRKIAHTLYPEEVPWVSSDLRRQHAGFAVLWLQYDHVVPHSHGGTSQIDNVVITCGLCNFGKHGYTLRQLGLTDPRDRPPVPSTWDGLQRLKGGPSPA